MTMLEKALALADEGYHVFPLLANSKKPAIKKWQDKATRDAEQITSWWTDIFDEYTNNNIGICTSRFGDDKALLVIDIDKKNGVDGFKSLELADYPPPAHISVTPTGGQHWIYVVDQPVKQGAHVLGAGLDIRSYGGYIVAPGSTIDGESYRWSE